MSNTANELKIPADSSISLNLTQQEAVEYTIDAPLKVIAGAGTGKTMVLTHRFVHIMKTHPDIAPYNILALTFTNKAAAEMKERIITLAQKECVIRSDAGWSPQLWVDTFHSFCGRILRENAFEAGLDPNFTVINEADIRQIHHRIVEDLVNLRLNTDEFRPDEYRYVGFDNPMFLYSPLLNFISKLKDQLISPDQFRELAEIGNSAYYGKLLELFNEAINSADVASKTKSALKERLEKNLPYECGFEAEMIELIYHVYIAYQSHLSRNDMMDFSDLIFRAYALLDGNERIRQRYQQQFKYILVDEFQDTNEAQLELLRLLARDDILSNVTVVGDDKQAIYGWRNARVENVDDFDADTWGGRSLSISQNYRSYGEILEVAHVSITHDEKFMKRSETIKLEPARLGMANKPIVVMYEAGSREQEAAFVASEIIKLLKTDVELDDIVILMRGLRWVKVYEDALRSSHIPYRTTGGTGFYDRQEIKDILAYLRVIDNPFDTEALIRVLKRPPVGLNDLSLYHLSKQRRDEGQLFDVLSRANEILEDRNAVRRIDGFLNLLEEMWKILGEGGILYLVSRLLDISGYLKYIHGKASDERERSLANIKKLLLMASEFERKHPFGDLRDFVQYVQFSMEQLVIEAEAGLESGRKAVQIMTVHQAKGLEFDVVFIINIMGKSFPTTPRHPRFAFSEEDGLIINDDLDGKKFLKYEPYDLKKNSYLYQKYGITNYYERFKGEHLSEERRIFYVATTRARHLLYLSCPGARKSDTERGRGTDFFQEIQDDLADTANICQFRRFDEEDADFQMELPLWENIDRPAFGSIEEAEEYGEYLRELIRCAIQRANKGVT